MLVIVGSTRGQRFADNVAGWLMPIVEAREDFTAKTVAFVSYDGWSGGVRSVEQLRQVVIELQMAPFRGAVVLQFAPRLFDAEGRMQNEMFFESSATRMLDDLSWWTVALKAARAESVG
jgi:NAD(P)H-dependent FMN reductase